MWWRGLALLLSLGTATSWGHGNRILMRRSEKSPFPQTNTGPLVQYCNTRLLETIKDFCKGLYFRSASSRQLALSSLPQRQAQSTFTKQLNNDREEYYDDFEYEESAVRNKRVAEAEHLKRNLVEECCLKPCHPSQFSKYCSFFNSNSPLIPATTTTTTTTTPAPPPTSFRSHRLVRNRVGFVDKNASQQEQIRQQIIRDAIECLLNPKCAQLDRYFSDPVPELPEDISPPSRFLKKPAKGHMIIGPTEDPSQKKSPNEISCSPKKGRKKRRRQQEKPERYVPIMVHLLRWLDRVSRPQQEQTQQQKPQASPRQQDDMFSSGSLANGRGGGIGDHSRLHTNPSLNSSESSQSNLNEDYNSNYHYVEGGTMRGQPQDPFHPHNYNDPSFGQEHGERPSKLTAVTDDPIPTDWVFFKH